jgi:NADH-quinone oxidoreductase subunit J
MVIESYVFLILVSFAVISSLGSLVTKDNFYSALYMSIALLSIAAVYALSNLQEVFILIAFIFVGAIGFVTVALAAVYKFMPAKQISKGWIIPSAVTALILSYIFYNKGRIVVEAKGVDLGAMEGYLTLIAAFISLMVLLMLSVIAISRGDSVD